MTITFDDIARMTGLEQLELWREGKIPAPTIGELFGFEMVELTEGQVTFEMSPDGRMLNPLGTVHGGIAATLLDSAMACAVHSTLVPGSSYTTAQLNVHYLRAMQPGMGPVRATGTVIHRGRKQSTAEGKLVGPDGKLIAHGTTVCLIL
ncbi:MAG: PaaI family thioesterase [Marmoricola sp.]